MNDRKIKDPFFSKPSSSPQLILSFLIKTILSIDLLYNTKKIIKPYELDIYLPKFKLAFEFDGEYWHRDRIEIDKIKYDLCLNKKIKLIRISDNRNDNCDYYKNIILNIKKSLIINLKEINNYCNTNIIEENINNISNEEIIFYIKENTLDYEKISEITKKYDNYTSFIKSEKSLYKKLLKLKCLDEYTKHMKKDIIYWNIDLCKIEIDKYTTYKEFKKNSKKCYDYIQRFDLLYLLDKFEDSPVKYSDNHINSIIDKYENYMEFIINNKNLYSYLVRNKKLNKIKHLKRNKMRHDLSEIYEHDYSKYKNTNHFKNENENLYNYARRKKLISFIREKIEHK